MPTTTEELTVYWIPGCGNCTRLKGYLQDRGIPFATVNVQEDSTAYDEMKSAGISSIPWVRRGDQWAPGADLDKVNELIGMATDAAGRILSKQELVERATRFLDLAADLARKLPADHYDDPTPTLDKYQEAFFFMADGAPYIPHGTFKSLVHHIAGHGEKFNRISLASDGVHGLGFSFLFATGEDGAFGEPDAATPMYRVAAQIELAAQDARAWLKSGQKAELSLPIETDWGVQTVQQLLQTMTCSLAQHSRQLTEVASRFGLEASDPLGDEDLEGLLMPSGVWA